MLVEKYKPKRVEDLVGQREAVAKASRWLGSWKRGGKTLLLHGPTGTGKTALVHALAAARGDDLIEMNASDYRSAKQIAESVGRSVEQRSLMKRGKIFLIDEIDGLSGNADRGGVAEVVKLIERSAYPIILTANDSHSQKLKPLKKVSVSVELKPIPSVDVERHLAKVAAKDSISIEPAALKEIARVSRGDMRAAMNDLESLGQGRRITLKDTGDLGARDAGSDARATLGRIFGAANLKEARAAAETADVDAEDLFWWIEGNLLAEFVKPEDVAAVFDALSRADMFRRRNETNMVDVMLSGIVAASQAKHAHAVQPSYKYPEYISLLAMSRFARRDEDELLAGLSAQLHCSVPKARTEFLPYLKVLGARSFA
ncbi:MAG: replication factor C large subunit [Candidatus Aenigmarchaeota archaeon]|nr:replication factor C large subunit [Candidatus Aenigmarchaeota archaeon]